MGREMASARFGAHLGYRDTEANAGSNLFMKTISTLLLALISLFVAAGLVLPALAKVRDFGSMPENVVTLYTVGVSLGLFGVWLGISTAFKLIWRAKNSNGK